jgi:hypothetical protein
MVVVIMVVVIVVVVIVVVVMVNLVTALHIFFCINILSREEP